MKTANPLHPISPTILELKTKLEAWAKLPSEEQADPSRMDELVSPPNF